MLKTAQTSQVFPGMPVFYTIAGPHATTEGELSVETAQGKITLWNTLPTASVARLGHRSAHGWESYLASHQDFSRPPRRSGRSSTLRLTRGSNRLKHPVCGTRLGPRDLGDRLRRSNTRAVTCRDERTVRLPVCKAMSLTVIFFSHVDSAIARV